MYKSKAILGFLLLSFTIFISGCDRAEDNESKFTKKIDTHVYENKYFDFNITLPDSWYAQDYESAKALAKQGGKLLAGDNKNLKAAAEAAKETTVNLFGFFKHPIGSAVIFNPNVIGVAENVALLPGIKRGSDYLFHAKRLLSQATIQYKIEPNFGVRYIDGVEFDVMSMSLEIRGLKLRQKYYSAIYKGYAIGFAQSYINNDGQKETSKILDSIRLNWSK